MRVPSRISMHTQPCFLLPAMALCACGATGPSREIHSQQIMWLAEGASQLSGDSAKPSSHSPLAGWSPPPPEAVPPWKVGPVVLPGHGTGWFVGTYTEVAEADVDAGFDIPAGNAISSGAVDWSATGAVAGVASSIGSAELLLGTGRFEDADAPAAKTDAGYTAALRFGTGLFQVDRISCGADAAFGAGYAEMAPSLGTSGSASWLQGDLRCALAYAPSPGALLAVSPVVGIGYRWLDGFQNIATPTVVDPQLDGDFIYGMAGASARWRPTLDLQLGIDFLLLVGDLEGFSFSFLIDF